MVVDAGQNDNAGGEWERRCTNTRAASLLSLSLAVREEPFVYFPPFAAGDREVLPPCCCPYHDCGDACTTCICVLHADDKSVCTCARACREWSDGDRGTSCFVQSECLGLGLAPGRVSRVTKQQQRRRRRGGSKQQALATIARPVLQSHKTLALATGIT